MPVPLRAKDYRFFARLQHSEQAPSGHATDFLSKPKQEVKGRRDYLWLHKRFEKPNLSEFEAAMAGLYALIEPERTPKVRAIYECDAEESMASISKVFPDFVDLKTYLANGINNDKVNQLVEMGLAEILASAYFFEEDDLHRENIGISGKKLVRIDFDMSAYSIVSNSQLRGPRKYAYTSKTPEEAFKITSRDLNQFPKLFDADPGYFPTKSRFLSPERGYSKLEMKMFSALTFHTQFTERAYQTWVKIILMPNSAFEQIIKSHISAGQGVVANFKYESTDEFDLSDSQKENYQEVLYSHFSLRKMQLKEELIKTPRFRFYWQNSSEKSFHKVMEEIEAYNVSLKEKYGDMKIDIDAMKKNYDELCQEMKSISDVAVSDLTILANDLAVWLERVENKECVLCKLRESIESYENETSGYFSYWLGNASEPVIKEAKIIRSKLCDAKNTMQFLQIISQLLSLSSPEAKNISVKFVSALLPEFSVQKTTQADPKKLVEALVVAIQPCISHEDGDWQTVSHFSDTLRESFSQPRYGTST